MMKTPHSFRWDKNGFWLDEKPFQIFSGEMHYQRIPREYWSHRLEMVKSMGCNTVAIYMFWNGHEPRQNEFNFEDMKDVAGFVQLAQKIGLWVILRPGPYCCGEWDCGGLPSYLLKDDTIRVRCMDPRYIEAVDRYVRRWAQELVPLQCTKGGPIILVQVENEYGSYGSDKIYLKHLLDLLISVGIEVPKFTCDGPSHEMLQNGALPDILTAVNFGRDPENGFKHLSEFKPDIPHICTEYYPGWFNHWGDRKMVHTNPIRAKEIVHDLEWMITNKKSWNLYMIHGGTTFGFYPGANYSRTYQPDVTSYDYSSPISENGQTTDLFYMIRDLMSKHRTADDPLPPIPEIPKNIQIGPIRFTQTASLFENLSGSIKCAQVHPMEFYGQSYGLILYRTHILKEYSGRHLHICALHDFGYVFFDDKLITICNRAEKNKGEGLFSIKIPKIEKESAQLDILVESHGRINYGVRIIDRKGIIEYVAINETPVLMNWEVFLIPLDQNYFEKLKYSQFAQNNDTNSIITSFSKPRIIRGTFFVESPGDAFLDCRPWKKGMVWINGKCLGRFWEIGPQYDLYMPGPWLKTGENEIIVLDMLGFQSQKQLKKLNKKRKKSR
jgi:beta-galactosidase